MSSGIIILSSTNSRHSRNKTSSVELDLMCALPSMSPGRTGGGTRLTKHRAGDGAGDGLVEACNLSRAYYVTLSSAIDAS